jgi:hypothetical protein
MTDPSTPDGEAEEKAMFEAEKGKAERSPLPQQVGPPPPPGPDRGRRDHHDGPPVTILSQAAQKGQVKVGAVDKHDGPWSTAKDLFSEVLPEFQESWQGMEYLGEAKEGKFVRGTKGLRSGCLGFGPDHAPSLDRSGLPSECLKKGRGVTVSRGLAAAQEKRQ